MTDEHKNRVSSLKSKQILSAEGHYWVTKYYVHYANKKREEEFKLLNQKHLLLKSFRGQVETTGQLEKKKRVDE